MGCDCVNVVWMCGGVGMSMHHLCDNKEWSCKEALHID